jgi:5-hydroxyisourate hydrolase-like protein (transthyretin family)
MIARHEVCLSMLIAFAACAQPPAPAGFAISGRVVDARSGDPVGKVKVAVSRTVGQRETMEFKTTAGDGRFHFESLAEGKYTLSAEGGGYPHQLLDEHQGFSTAVAVGPGLASDDIVFPLHPDAAISGRVTDEHGEPVQAAQVWLFRPEVAGFTTTVQTDDLGKYKFRHQPPGNYVIAVLAQPWYAEHQSLRRYHSAQPTVAAPSVLDVVFPLTFYGGATSPARAARIALTWGQSVTADVVLNAVPAVRLHVHTPTPSTQMDQQTDARASVADGPNRMSFFYDGPLAPAVTLTRQVFGVEIPLMGYSVDPKPGMAEIGGLPPGTYSMAVTTAGEKPSTVHKVIDTSAGPDVDATGGGRSVVEVTGELELDGGKLPETPGAMVRFNDVETKQWTAAQITEEARFALQVPSGKYEIDVTGGPDLFLQSMRGSGARVTGSTIEVGAEPVALKLSVAHGLGQVDGVAMREGKPQGGAHVLLVSENHSEMRSRRDQSDSDGTFTLASIPPGKYVVVAIKNWDLDWQDPTVLRPYLAQGVPVQVEAGGKYKVQVDIQ